MKYLFGSLTHLAGAALILLLAACGGSGSTPAKPAPVISSASSSSQPSSSSSSQQSSSHSSSSSSTHSLPDRASNGAIYCTPAGSDPDGDGWGWENNATCLVRNSQADPDRGDFDGCIIDTGSWPYCAADNGSWGLEEETVCISRSFCPAHRSAEQSGISSTPVTLGASAKTRAVYQYLLSIHGSKTLSGQQDLTWFDGIDMFQRVLDDTGKAPAIMGYDFMNYGLANLSGLQQTEEGIAHWDRGGLVSFAWHWRDPSRETLEFYADRASVRIPVSKGQLDTGSSLFAKMRDDIDMIAAELKRLEDAGVVVLWRPLHEASGGWFWWGASRSDDIAPAYAQTLLWRYMFDRLTHHHQLTNLIWVWNGQSAAWYPGDAYVDIVSMDIYDGRQNYQSQIEAYQQVKSWPLQAKPVALSENSNIPDPDNIAADGAWWLWFMVWNDSNTAPGVSHQDNFWTGEYYNTNAHKVHVYNHPGVINLDDLPSFD